MHSNKNFWAERLNGVIDFLGLEKKKFNIV